jgi:hypothetical protein
MILKFWSPVATAAGDLLEIDCILWMSCWFSFIEKRRDLLGGQAEGVRGIRSAALAQLRFEWRNHDFSNSEPTGDR